MSLYHNPRDYRTLNPRKRKKSQADGETVEMEMYSCNLCADEYDSETDLYVHKKSKHRLEFNKMLLEEMVCKTCIKQQSSYESLVKHTKTQHLLSSEDSEYVERDIYICNICNLIYFNKQMLVIHILYNHDIKNRKRTSSECPKCSKIVQMKNVWFHFQRHSIQSLTCCPICLKKCKNQKQLDTHVREHPGYYHCDICQYDASTKSYFVTHMQSHSARSIDDEADITRENRDKVSNDVLRRCFVPQVNAKKSDFNVGLRGLRLYELQICVLCRAICTDTGRADHIWQCHVVHQAPPKKKRYMCLCGEEFFNNVLLKHHVFKMKGDDHQAWDMGEVPSEGNIEVTLLVEEGTLACTVME